MTNRGKYGQYYNLQNLKFSYYPIRSERKVRSGRGLLTTLGKAYDYFLKSFIWFKKREFLYEPDKDNPFYFVDSEGKKIVPVRCLTDFGSVPRPFWPLLSLIDFVPAYFVHDYEYAASHCNVPEGTFGDANRRLCEGIRTCCYDDDGKSNEILIFIVWLAVTVVGYFWWYRRTTEMVFGIMGEEKIMSKYEAR